MATAGLAEGIDFKDDLCRLLLVVGVPYPNIGDAYIKERQKLDSRYCTEKAIRAVNQCAGRAIRWAGDWAKIVFIDKRWATLRQYLSKWILEGQVKIDEW